MTKYYKIYTSLILLTGFVVTTGLYSQTEESTFWTTGADIYSSYIWRGIKYGTGPAVQPVLEYTSGPFTAGAWGSFDFRGYQEVDLYLNYSFPSGFSTLHTTSLLVVNS